MHISRLRLLGFKSFVEPTELHIEHGLTGVVGPNGCGKSNLLEALRWAMGETSYKAMRASAMEDVIFAGTTTRPARNWAEVTMFIDNSARTAPPEFNDSDVLELTRRIERDMGSAYRVNGRDVRARDVKILFEDAATGARSPALVRQGQIGEIVNAKPEQRRRILEDAAGVAGLHTRRHDAELRLKAAEDNLARLGDVIGGLASQMEGLKRQARHARRYRELSGEIRATEALAAHLAWMAAEAEVATGEAALRDALVALGQATEAEARALAEEVEAAAAMPPLREEEATRGAVVARLRIERDSFEKEAERLARRREELAARQGQLDRDLVREQGLAGEAEDMRRQLVDEAGTIAAEADGDADREAGLADAQAAGEAALAEAESRHGALTRRAFEARARLQSLERTATEQRAALDKAKREIQSLETQRREVAARAPDIARHTATTEAGQRLVAEMAEIEAHTLAAEATLEETRHAAAAAQEASATARLDASRLTTEIQTLSKLLGPVRDDGLPPVIDQLRVAPGLEMALGAALGDDLDAPVAEAAAMHWRLVAPVGKDPALPAGIEPLAAHVDGPPELRRRLGQIGVVERADGRRLQAMLRPGQRLVSRDGGLWRWDGFVSASDAPSPAALRLAERNRLGAMLEAESVSRQAAEARADEARHLAERLAAAEAEARRLRNAWRERQTELARVREALTAIERQARETESRLAAIGEARSRTEAAATQAGERLIEIETALEGLEADAGLDDEVVASESTVREARAQVSARREAAAAEARRRRAREERGVALAREIERWATRSTEAATQLAQLTARRDETATELAAFADLPAALEERRGRLIDELGAAELRRQEAADRHAAAETTLREAQTAMRSAQAAVTEAREVRARNDAQLEGARSRRMGEARRIQETLECQPEDCLKLVGDAVPTPLPDRGDIERQLTRLKAERERLGGVNLNAEEDLARINDEHARLDTERLDVEAAIAKLRGAIGQLNREGKKRLNEAFETVNGHFQRLFGTLFGGGEARLEMIESAEDPLEGGLEIIAKPPGKKPATLSLLSGGEQTLTALSLIFAVFLTNPSPICVLDEVDAPLDDSNVDRFCTLMESMAADTATRFLVITHHPMTMARMNRLFGVTMGEKGVSQLVSVDLATAERIIEEEPGAAQQGAA